MAARVNPLFDRHPECEVDFACARCERPFGRYFLEAQDDGSICPVDPSGHPFGAIPKYGTQRVPGFGAISIIRWVPTYWEPRYGWTRRRKGPRPRTGTGLHPETFGGRHYLRVICKCGRNEKLRPEKLDAALFHPDGSLRLRDGVLFL